MVNIAVSCNRKNLTFIFEGRHKVLHCHDNQGSFEHVKCIYSFLSWMRSFFSLVFLFSSPLNPGQLTPEWAQPSAHTSWSICPSDKIKGSGVDKEPLIALVAGPELKSFFKPPPHTHTPPLSL